MMWSRTATAAALPVAAVAVFAAIQSYSHIEGLALAQHQSLTDARLLPLSVDFLIAAGSVLLLSGSRLGWLCVIPGAIATLLANVVTGWPYGLVAAVVAGWPAVAFILASAALERWLRSQVGHDRPEKVRDTKVSEPAPVVADPEPVAAMNGTGTWTAARSGWS